MSDKNFLKLNKIPFLLKNKYGRFLKNPRKPVY